jgi:predicted amidophosphoribosyltransferase
VTEADLRTALLVPRPNLVAKQRLLVFDDVFTDSSTLQEVAKALLDAGAQRIDGLVLARQPWRLSVTEQRPDERTAGAGRERRC